MSAQIIAFPRPFRKSREQEREEWIEKFTAMHINWARTPEEKKGARNRAEELVEQLEEAAREMRRKRRTEAGGEPPSMAS